MKYIYIRQDMLKTTKMKATALKYINNGICISGFCIILEMLKANIVNIQFKKNK